MNIAYSLFLFFTFSCISAQSPVGVYLPLKNLSLKNLFSRIPSYDYLNIKIDSSYYHELLFGSFLEKESGIWRMFNDTLMLYSIEENTHEYLRQTIIAQKTDSLIDKLRVKIIDKRGIGIKGVRLVIYSDFSKSEYITDDNGTIYTKFIKFDSLSIKKGKYIIAPIKNLTKINESNDYCILLNQIGFIFKKNKLYNLQGLAVARKK